MIMMVRGVNLAEIGQISKIKHVSGINEYLFFLWKRENLQGIKKFAFARLRIFYLGSLRLKIKIHKLALHLIKILQTLSHQK
jgi:hypothetical protein